MRPRRFVAVAVARVLAGGCAAATEVAVAPESTRSPRATAVPSTGPAPDLPAGWRWECYGNVQIAVPGDWGHDLSGDGRLFAFCVGGPDRTVPPPGVGRPFGALSIGCTGDDAQPGEPGDPGTTLAEAGSFVAFRANVDRLPYGVHTVNDRTTVVAGPVTIHVQAPRDLRERIVATRHRIEVDDAGCPIDDPVSTDPAARPSPAVAVGELRDVQGLAACRNALGGGVGYPPVTGPSLLSSLGLDAAAAHRVLAAVAAAPAGSGPNSPQACSSDYGHGSQAIVLRVASAAGRTRIVVRYDACDFNGADDGTGVRTVRREWIGPLLAGPNGVNSSVGAMGEVLIP